jgi:hypothetical protein
LEVTVPRILIDVIGAVLITVSVINARMQFTRLRNHHGSRASQIALSAPAGIGVRVALGSAVGGIWLLFGGGWAVAGVMLAIIAWEIIVQVTGLWLRYRIHPKSD